MPGHGTVPGGLTQATAEDWMAAVRMGVRHVRRTVGADRPMVLVGYSNGGALAVRYALEAAADSAAARPSRLVLISPMIGVSPLARLARVISALGPLPFFEKARWLDVVPEYNPFKFNSFPANAGNQSYRVSSLLKRRSSPRPRTDSIERLPPILTFQSIVDATVSTAAVVHDLFDQLRGKGHELVVFDINRRAGLEPYIRPADAALVARWPPAAPRLYRRTLITNASADVPDVVARASRRSRRRRKTRRSDSPGRRRCSPSRMSRCRSRSTIRSTAARRRPAARSRSDRLSPRGEKAVLTVPVEALMRIGWNPFLPYVLNRINSI